MGGEVDVGMSRVWEWGERVEVGGGGGERTLPVLHFSEGERWVRFMWNVAIFTFRFVLS